MSGDYTRMTFDPRRRFIAVDMQQGRVQLDADWNEQADLGRERTRLLGLDSGGPAWLPLATTPNAFLVGALAGPPVDLSLGAGRIYVDGRLAEIFADEAVSYLHQPFLPDPPPLAPATDTIVYLDLWEREVTWAEMPALLDVALGGIDTTTRVQQVWQVKLHSAAGMSTCGVDLGALFPPSGGRLTTSANAPPAPDDPCILPPNAGYRGIENRLYRVEVQTGGALGTALFKWSRDNGSIVSRVSAIAVAGGQSRLTVNRIGRDGTLRFRINDWVTLTDDARELNGEAGQMARIIDIDEAARVVVLDRAVPTAGRAFGAGADIALRNTRLQRWDESAPLNPLDGDGLMSTAAGPLLLEDGVEVGFSVAGAGGVFDVGDYWVFAARTADASVEILNAARPRGIRHQYLQVAAIPAGGVPTDCRPATPVGNDAGCCTFVVRPGEDIQKAIDALPPVGGCICLKAGQHVIDKPLLLRHDNVTLHGESLGAVVVNARGTGLIVIAQAQRDRIYSLTLRQGEAAAAPVIYIEGAEDITIDDCRIETVARVDSIGIAGVESSSLTITGCHFEEPALGIWLHGGCELVTISANEFRLATPGPNLPETVAVLAQTMRGALFVEDNLIANAVNGVVVNDAGAGSPVSRARGSRVTHNIIALIDFVTGTRRYGIDAAAAEMLVTGNEIIHQGGEVAGIRLTGNGSNASGNIVVTDGKAAGIAIGILAGDEQAGKFLPVERLVIADNIVEGRQFGIGLTGIARSFVTGNILGRDGAALVAGIVLATSTDTTIAGNEVLGGALGVLAIDGARNAYRDNAVSGGRIGIGLSHETAPIVSGNRLTGIGQFGILVMNISERCEITANRIVRCGAAATAFAGGIVALIVFGELHLVGNEVMDTGVAPPAAGGGGVPPAYGIAGVYILEARVTSNLVTYSSPTLRPVIAEDRALLMQGWIEAVLPGGPAGPGLVAGFAVQVSDNKFVGTGAGALVELREQIVSDLVRLRFERVLFCGNYCNHISPAFDDSFRFATVSLVGRQCSVSANHVKATTPQYRSWHLHDMPGPFIGNVSHEQGWDRSPAAGFPAPEQNFNLIA